MFDEPSERPSENPVDPADRAKEKADEFRTHAERAAVYEGARKFDAQLLPKFDAELAREVQKTIGRLEKSKSPESPILPPPTIIDAANLLNLPETRGLSTNDYHIYRRPGEVMIGRWLAGDQVETFYERMQAHFDVALDGFKEDERQALAWKKDPKTLAYLAALDAIEIKMAARYLRDLIRAHNLYVLSTQVADEIDILHLTDHLMGVEPANLVGETAAPWNVPTEQERAWFFKLFSLRGMGEGTERMCFFTYLQKSDETFGGDE